MMNFQGGRRRGEDGIAVVINFLLSNARLVLGVAGTAMLGIATLAVKRLIERAGRAAEEEKVEQKMAESWEELSLVSSSPTLIKKGLEGVVMQHVAKATRPQKADLCRQSQTSSDESKAEPKSHRVHVCVPTLQDRLLHFYHTRAALSPLEVQRAQSQALDICTEIQGFLHSRLPDMPLGEMSLGGSLLDDLQVVSADHACLLVPLQLETSLWRLIPGEATLLTHPLHWMVRRVNLEYFPRGRSYWDRYLVGGYLSAEAVVNMLSKVVMETMNWPSISSTLDCLVRPVLGGPELRLEIGPTNESSISEQRLFISVLPLLRKGDVVLTSQPELTAPWLNAWHLSLYPWETQRLAQLDTSDDGCRRLTLKLLKAVCRLNPALRPLDSTPLVNLILHLSEREGNWSECSLHLRFRQCIAELIGHLEQEALHSYFKPTVNLLSGLTEDQVDQMGFMLYCATSEPEILLI
ncbi:mitochondrial dynamics protein MID49 [Dunckerocampus dactyliophorus]|uniref:mitochondrial dynamics protein MID49 n=1 Tax=Dunckerocampus dactyliophorus TaxID=161453 RepID=UPI002405A5F9|nr:mitochondrial dynamics protein MID49 [Dunckerocampus dactyliophorus]XP_054636342.1 mitochondrial dynamics protein MID49 [Dunckerocampus dactyliophorus]